MCRYHADMDTTYQSGVKFRARPDKSMQGALNQWIGCQRVVYNAKVAEDSYFAAQRRLHLRDDPDAECKTPLAQQYSQFKSELTPWLVRGAVADPAQWRLSLDGRQAASACRIGPETRQKTGLRPTARGWRGQARETCVGETQEGTECDWGGMPQQVCGAVR
jgi:hypothetical protein